MKDSPLLRKTTQFFSYYVAPVVMISAALLIKYPDIFSKLGTIAMLAVTANLFIKPASVIFPLKALKLAMTYRREIGIASFWVVIGHVLGLYINNYYSLDNLSTPAIWGIIAMWGMVILALTSNNWATKTLKRNWVKIQRAAYPTLFLILIHASLAEGEFKKLIVIGSTYITLKFIEYKKTH